MLVGPFCEYYYVSFCECPRLSLTWRLATLVFACGVRSLALAGQIRSRVADFNHDDGAASDLLYLSSCRAERRGNRPLLPSCRADGGRFLCLRVRIACFARTLVVRALGAGSNRGWRGRFIEVTFRHGSGPGADGTASATHPKLCLRVMIMRVMTSLRNSAWTRETMRPRPPLRTSCPGSSSPPLPLPRRPPEKNQEGHRPRYKV